jgi:hypothetical protein
MRRAHPSAAAAVAFALLAASVGCSASGDETSTTSGTSTTSATGGSGGSSGVGGMGGIGFGGSGTGGDPCAGGGGCDCSEIAFNIDTQQACALSVLDGFTLDGEGFITVQSQQHRVFAIDRWGAGHIIAWCDSTTAPQLLMAFDALGYLGQVPNPRVASFGDDFLCRPGALPNSLPMNVQYQGVDLPSMYQNNAAGLAADWDVVIFCGFRQGWSYPWTSEIQEFVATHGKGFLALMDYEGVVTQTDFTNMSNITSPSGIVFDPLNLPWSAASAAVTLDCVPDVPPPPK